MSISYEYGWLPVYPPTVRLSVSPSVYPLLFFSLSADCPSPFRLPGAGCPSIRQLSITVSTADCASICPSVCLSSTVFLYIHQLPAAVSTDSTPTTRRTRTELAVCYYRLVSHSPPPTHAAARGRDADLAPPPTTEGEGMSKIDSSCHRHAY